MCVWGGPSSTPQYDDLQRHKKGKVLRQPLLDGVCAWCPRLPPVGLVSGPSLEDGSLRSSARLGLTRGWSPSGA